MKAFLLFFSLFLSALCFAQPSPDSANTKSPVEINSVKVIPSPGSQYKNIQVAFKNVSKQKVKTIKFRWSGVNALDEKADMDHVTGDITDNYKPGKKGVATFNTLSSNLAKVETMMVYEVVFQDGSVWKM